MPCAFSSPQASWACALLVKRSMRATPASDPVPARYRQPAARRQQTPTWVLASIVNRMYVRPMQMRWIETNITAPAAADDGCAMRDNTEEPRPPSASTGHNRGRRRPARPMRRVQRIGRGPTRTRLIWVRCPSRRKDDTAREHRAAYTVDAGPDLPPP